MSAMRLVFKQLGMCSCLNSPPDFDATYSLFTYNFPLDSMMQRYKYGNELNIGNIFGQMLSKTTDLTSVDLIIPMPMHHMRLRERGFNQAPEIAKIITKNYLENWIMPLPIVKNARHHKPVCH